MPKVQMNLHAVIIFGILLVASMGGNYYQFKLGQQTFQDFIDAKWELGNAEASLINVRGKYEQCAETLGISPIIELPKPE